MAHEPPAGLTAPQAAAVVAVAHECLVPATKGLVLTVCRDLLGFGRQFNIKIPENRQGALLELYLETLMEVPVHYLALILERCKRTWSWGNRMPFPAELSALVGDEVKAMRTLEAKATAMRLKIDGLTAAKAAAHQRFIESHTRETGQTADQVLATAAAIRDDMFVRGFSASQAKARQAQRAAGVDPDAVPKDLASDLNLTDNADKEG